MSYTCMCSLNYGSDRVRKINDYSRAATVSVRPSRKLLAIAKSQSGRLCTYVCTHAFERPKATKIGCYGGIKPLLLRS